MQGCWLRQFCQGNRASIKVQPRRATVQAREVLVSKNRVRGVLRLNEGHREQEMTGESLGSGRIWQKVLQQREEGENRTTGGSFDPEEVTRYPGQERIEGVTLGLVGPVVLSSLTQAVSEKSSL